MQPWPPDLALADSLCQLHLPTIKSTQLRRRAHCYKNMLIIPKYTRINGLKIKNFKYMSSFCFERAASKGVLKNSTFEVKAV
jgi:hypothetical protein